MIYLLAKYTLLFLLAAALGFLLGYWWSRRNFVDVTESFEDLRKTAERDDSANWDKLWARIDALPQPKETDLSPVYQRLDGVSTLIERFPTPEKVDLGTLESRIDALTSKVAGIPEPADISPLQDKLAALETAIREVPGPADMTPIEDRLSKLGAAVAGIPKPEPQKELDLEPVKKELATLQRQIQALPKVETHGPVDITPIARRIDAVEQRITRIPAPEKVDLTPVGRKIDQLEQRIAQLPKAEKVDLNPVSHKIDRLEQRIGRMPAPDKIDLQPIDRRLRGIETEIARVSKKVERPAKVKTASAPRKKAATSRRARAERRPGEPTILSAALYGKKDDLKQISGVGPKLERLLNRNGVYYFWQVASWSRQDIDVIDKRLDAFKGRISRDNWVTQAKQLRKSPAAAQMPANI